VIIDKRYERVVKERCESERDAKRDEKRCEREMRQSCEKEL
jgi:hypothetical protein